MSTRGSTSRGWRLARLASVLALLAPGCVLDTENPCGNGQVPWEGNEERCVCAEGYGYTPQGCVRCGEHELPAPGGGCMCEPQYARGPSGVCEPVPEGIGTPCTTDAECTPGFPHCQPSAAGGYCTKTGCASSAECAGYACNTSGAPSFCQRPPFGAGQSCESDADCADTEAVFCDVFVSRTCLVPGCTVAPADSCFEGFECCDLSGFGLPTLCLPEGQCQE